MYQKEPQRFQKGVRKNSIKQFIKFKENLKNLKFKKKKAKIFKKKKKSHKMKNEKEHQDIINI